MDTPVHQKRAHDPSYCCRVEPAAGGGYNVFCLGSAHLYPQGAVHEKGLAFDANAIPAIPLNPHLERPVAPSWCHLPVFLCHETY